MANWWGMGGVRADPDKFFLYEDRKLIHTGKTYAECNEVRMRLLGKPGSKPVNKHHYDIYKGKVPRNE